jgi:hypothetical protein
MAPFDNRTVSFDDVAAQLKLDQDEPNARPQSSYWGHLDGDDLAKAVVDYARRFKEWQDANGLRKGWKLKTAYYHNEYRTDTTVPHLSLMEQWGAQGEFQFVSLNHLRSLLKTVIASVVQNPPSFQPVSTNADADAMEAAALYQGVLDYYSRELRLTSKINQAVEIGVVVDQGFMMVEWDPFAVDGAAPANTDIWRGAPSVRVLYPWDVTYDVTKQSWADLDWVIVRDWVDREKVKAQFPEFADDIEKCRSKSEVMSDSTDYDYRYDTTQFPDMSNDIQVYKYFHRPQSWMPQGRFCMVLESGKLLFESPVGLMYPRLPVERFVPDETVDILLGYSPINELLAPQENVNALLSAITTNTNNFAHQFILCEAGTEMNAKTFEDGQRIIEYPREGKPPQGLNLTAIPDVLFHHLQNVMNYMQTIPGVSNASRGQAPGANSTGSAMLFLSSQTTQNQGSMSENYQQFAAAVMTSLLHVLRVFARTEKTINIMGKNVASRSIMVSDTLKDFDEVVVQMNNQILNTAQGRLAFAQQMMQYGNATAQQALQVATSGNLGAVTDPAREALYELQLENEWLLAGDQVEVNALDDHEQHVGMHKRLFATPWLRKPALAERMGQTQAPAILQGIQDHIMSHMGYLSQNQTASVATQQAGVEPGQAPVAASGALGHAQPPQPSPNAPSDSPAQAAAINIGSHMPAGPSMPKPPK